jgi:hypothetical protein
MGGARLYRVVRRRYLIGSVQLIQPLLTPGDRMTDPSVDDHARPGPVTSSPSPHSGTPPYLGIVIAVFSFVLVFLVLVHYLNTPTATAAAVLAAVPGILWAALGWRRRV